MSSCHTGECWKLCEVFRTKTGSNIKIIKLMLALVNFRITEYFSMSKLKYFHHIKNGLANSKFLYPN